MTNKVTLAQLSSEIWAVLEYNYKRLVKKRVGKDGIITIRCPKGLWLVMSSGAEKADTEARRYFLQYFMDGEYNDFIK